MMGLPTGYYTAYLFGRANQRLRVSSRRFAAHGDAEFWAEYLNDEEETKPPNRRRTHFTFSVMAPQPDPKAFRFKPTVWTDDAHGGSEGIFHGRSVRLEAYGDEGDLHWTIIRDNRRYDYTRGGKKGERTLDDVKAIAEKDMRDNARKRYERAKSLVEYTERNHL
jgi:transglutaminase-like putative cysteine protease